MVSNLFLVLQKRMIVFMCILYVVQCNAQMDQCKAMPAYFTKLGVKQGQGYLSTSERNFIGLVLIESEQPGNPNAKILKKLQDSSWKNKGYLGAISTDQFGNSYVLPANKVNTLNNSKEKQNTIYKVDGNTGIMETFIDLPMETLPGPYNPFGLLGSFYDCSNSHLIVSSVAGSSQSKEIGKVYIIDTKTKSKKVILENKDIYGLALHMLNGKRMLYLSSARKSKLYSMELDQQNNPIGMLKEELSIGGLGPRGDDKIRKIRFLQDGKMQLNTVLFYYNLTAPSEDQTSKMVFAYDQTSKSWKLFSIE